MISLRIVLAPMLAAAPAMGQGREEVGFQLQHAPAPGAAVFLQGSLDELGGGDVLESQWMSSPDGVQWSITVSLPLGHTYSYRFIERQAGHTVIGDPQNFLRITVEDVQQVAKTYLTGPFSRAVVMSESRTEELPETFIRNTI